MNQKSLFVVIIIISVSSSLLTYSFIVALAISPLFLNEALAQQDDVGGSSEQCPPNQHTVGSTNQCEWDNCGSATPPMYRNTQTGRCVTDCSEVGQFWVKQGNICVLGTSTQSPPPSGSSVSNQGEGNGNATVQTEAKSEIPSDNATSSNLTSNVTSTPPSTITQTIGSLAGEPALPYACLSNTFTCYCDGTEDCMKLTSSGECKAEVRTVEGKPGLGECDWNTKS
jgi:hypothetical protein